MTLFEQIQLVAKKRGMGLKEVAIKAGIGENGQLETCKLLDDLPCVLGRKLTMDEQVAIVLAVPGVAA